MRALRKALASLLMLIAVPVIGAQIVVSVTRDLVTDPGFAKQAVRDSGAYQEIERFLIEQIAVNMGGADAELGFTELEVQQIVRRVLPAAQIQAHIEMMIDGAYAWMEAGGGRPDIVLDFTVSAAALPQAVKEVLLAKIEALPACSPAQAASLAATYDGGMPPCKSPDANFNRQMVERAIPEAELKAMIPARFDLAEIVEAEQGPGVWDEMHMGMAAAKTGLDAIPLGWGVVAILLALIGVLNLDRWYTPFGWVGAALLTASLPILIGALVGINFVAPLLENALLSDMAGDVPGTDVAVNLVRFAMGTIGVGLRNLSMIVALGGLGCVIAAVAGKITYRPAGSEGTRAAS